MYVKSRLMKISSLNFQPVSQIVAAVCVHSYDNEG